MGKKLKKILLTIFLGYFTFLPFVPLWANDFDPNYIISDEEINDYNSLTLQDIRDFLEEHGSYLAHYTCHDKEGNPREAAEVIYTLAQQNKINPKFMLVLLQKEQGLVENPHPTQRQLDAATGYGCPDGGSCNPRWKGFFKQVNSAYLQFRSYLDEYYLYRYQPRKTYIFSRYNTSVKTIDIVTPLNRATAALYNYTPHVYYGNYNFWRIWNKYFPKKRHYYPDGSLLRVKGQPGIYLIQNGLKRPFLTKSAFASRYSFDKVIEVEKSILDAYDTGNPIKFPNYSLLKTPEGTIYLLVDDTLRKIASQKVFRKIGFNPEEVIDVENQDILSYEVGAPITEEDIYPLGALLQDTSTGGIYWVKDGIKHPLWDKLIMEINFPNKKIIPASSQELSKYQTGAPVKLPDGTLIKSVLDPRVYVISNGKKLPIANEKTFTTLGYKWNDIIEVNGRVLEIHETGPMLDITVKNNAELASF